MSLDLKQVLDYVVIPVLQVLAPRIPYTQEATKLVLGTGYVESRYHWIDQRDKAGSPGPAYGLWQIEELTFRDVLDRAPSAVKDTLSALRTRLPLGVAELHGNLFLGAALCRMKYYLAPEPVPKDPRGAAEFWKLRYNTPLGAGTVEKAIPYFDEVWSL